MDRLARTRVHSPIDGVVLGLRFKTVGGVLKVGEPILDIVPSGEGLVVNAQVLTTDIDEVHPGVAVGVRLRVRGSRVVRRGRAGERGARGEAEESEEQCETCSAHDWASQTPSALRQAVPCDSCLSPSMIISCV